MTQTQLFESIKKTKSFLCVGLDTDISKVPTKELEKKYGIGMLRPRNSLIYFNRSIIEATHDLAPAYKINFWFYADEEGCAALASTVKYIKTHYPDKFVIIDAKVGDIKNTGQQARIRFLNKLPADSVTISPYMGRDVANPFLEEKNKSVTVLALTSNESATDFQLRKLANGFYLYEEVLLQAKLWGTEDQIQFVVGATKAEYLTGIRKLVPHNFLLIPGVGSQGGSLEDVAKYGMNDKCGLLVNVSRKIIFADSGENFAEEARHVAVDYQVEMEELLKGAGIV